MEELNKSEELFVISNNGSRNGEESEEKEEEKLFDDYDFFLDPPVQEVNPLRSEDEIEMLLFASSTLSLPPTHEERKVENEQNLVVLNPPQIQVERSSESAFGPNMQGEGVGEEEEEKRGEEEDMDKFKLAEVFCEQFRKEGKKKLPAPIQKVKSLMESHPQVVWVERNKGLGRLEMCCMQEKLVEVTGKKDVANWERSLKNFNLRVEKSTHKRDNKVKRWVVELNQKPSAKSNKKKTILQPQSKPTLNKSGANILLAHPLHSWVAQQLESSCSDVQSQYCSLSEEELINYGKVFSYHLQFVQELLRLKAQSQINGGKKREEH